MKINIVVLYIVFPIFFPSYLTSEPMKPMKQWNTEIDKAYHVYQVQEEHEATSQWSTLYNVLFVQYVFLPTEQAET